MDAAGEEIVPALPNVYIGSSVGLFQAEETIEETDLEDTLTGSFGTVSSDTIVHFLTTDTLNPNKEVIKTEDKRIESANIKQLKNL